MLVTDNGTVFTSKEFSRFTKQNGIRHVRSAPYHPASNGLVERAVQTFKNFMTKMKGGSVEVNVSCFLLQYRITPHSTTGVSPAEMLLGRCLRSRLDLVVPDIRSKVLKKQQTQIINHDKKARNQNLQVGDAVSVSNFPSGNGWLPGVIEERSGPLSFQIKLQDGRIVQQHIDHIIYRSSSEVVKTSYTWMDLPQISKSDTTELISKTNETAAPPLRRSTRVSVPPKRNGQENIPT